MLTLHATYRDATNVSAASTRETFTAEDYEAAREQAVQATPAGSRMLYVMVDR